ncbi:helix-hairpin-helix domain-containing protein [Kitasatospora sp. KL5]|uniref:helix-hairpin-helix domain-containing protein n=1 Tax=Kitasatospora sp. KL5 TaxID=3425125 RepID=UPI003D6DB487
MRTTTRGAARRRETTETVRRRLAALFTTALRGGPPRSSRAPTGGRAQAGPGGPTGPDPAGTAPPAGPGGTAPDRPSGSGRSPRRRAVRDGPQPPAPQPAVPPQAPAAFAAADPGGVPPDAPRSAAARRFGLSLPAGLVLDRRAALGLAALLLLAVGYAVQHFWLSRPEPVAVPTVSGSASAVAGDPVSAAPGGSGMPGPPGAPAPTVVVDVAGKVQHPGLRTLPTGSRVADALQAAGGALPGTDTDALNLARVLSDGEQILVGAPAGQAAPGSTQSAPISLNRATAEQLDTLPGVGPTLAQRILLYRQQHGPFRSIDQLRQVPGIGERKFGEIKGLLTL